ncbi:MAG TPA: type II toxin-antitoxin system VapC family toxin [Rhizomicrobium sp.]|jgi:predicted nucleic acid-binding protein
MKVVDASAVLAVLLDEPERTIIERLLTNERLVAPPILPFEVTNTCAMNATRVPDGELLYADALANFFGWEIALHNVDLVGTFVLARRYGLTAYDASYLWLSRELGLGLVTLDKALLSVVQSS